jgi:hypothetical protein
VGIGRRKPLPPQAGGAVPALFCYNKAMHRSRLLLLDALVNFVLGVFLIEFPRNVVDFLGVPQSEVAFYPSVLGVVLLGIAIALWVEYKRPPQAPAGLGLAGAIAINLLGAVVLVAWLLFGKLEIPLRGQVLMWGLALLLIVVGLVELTHCRAKVR